MFGKRNKGAGADKPAPAQTPAPSTRPVQQTPVAATPAVSPIVSPPAGAGVVHDPQALEADVAKSRRTLLAFGEIVSVLMRVPEYRNSTLAQIQALTVPAIASGQFLVATAHSKSRSLAMPVAVAMWANVSEAVDARLSSALDVPMTLDPAEWTNGSIAWLMVLVGDTRIINPTLANVQKTKLKGRPLKVRMKGPDGKSIVRAFSPATENPEQAVARAAP